MTDNVFQGSLSRVSLPQILFQIWQRERTGCLMLNKPGRVQTLCFEKGSLFIDGSEFQEKDFLESLAGMGHLSFSGLEACEDYVRQGRGTRIKALIELEHLQIAALWRIMESEFKKRAFRLFDWDEGSFFFKSPSDVSAKSYVQEISLPPFILEGIRHMQNHDLIAAHLPGDDDPIQDLAAIHRGSVPLASHEKYVLGLIGDGKSLGEIRQQSDLGDKETRRILFTLCSFELVGTAPRKGANQKPQADYSPAEIERLFGTFNDKCSYIFKYISKELGPVALNVLEKALEEVKSRLDPALQTLELTADGRIELKSYLKMNLSHSSEAGRRSLLRSLDEILAVEVLAVKRTLGNSHESILVKNLEKVGEIP